MNLRAWFLPLAVSAFTLAALPAAARDAKTRDARAWPAAYEPVAMTAKELLAEAKRAGGTLGTGSHTARITMRYRDGGLDGTSREVWSGEDFRDDSTEGPFITAEGRYKGQLWETNENGYTLLKRGIHHRAEANASALAHPDASDDVQVLGRLRAPADVYVLRVAPENGRPERRFYDATTLRLVRRETTYLDSLVVSTYDDYRTVNGATLAFRTSISDGHPENDEVFTIESLNVDVPVADSELQIPGSRRLPLTMPDGAASVRLPARIDGGRVIVRVTINGRGLDFQLDSGADGIVLNRDVVRQLGLTTVGRWSNTVAGSFTSGRAIIPKLNVGPLVMTDVVVDSLPFAFQNDDATRVVGLLGFDFIAGCVLKIDYVHGTLDAIPSERFEPPAGGVVVDAILDDRVPMVSLNANGALGEHFVLDTGADDIVFFTPFAKKYPSAVDDHSPKKALSRMFNAVYADGVGGKLEIRPVLIANMQLANVKYVDYLAFVMLANQASFEGEDNDGLIGAAMLGSFDVYLDYAGSRVVLVPNARTKKLKTAS